MDFKKVIIKLGNGDKIGELISIEEKIMKVRRMITVKSNNPIILYGYRNEDDDPMSVYRLQDDGTLGEMITKKCGIIKAANSEDWILIPPNNHNSMSYYFIIYYRLAKVDVFTFESGGEVIYIKEFI